jgi:phosphatidylserine/phosphatidylglycerophosphate/cardiolipin synthase-like enzyme
MDNKNIAGITLQKLRNAAKRGVKVFLIIDDLCFYANKELIRMTHAAVSVNGGMVIRHNPCGKYKINLLEDRPVTFFQRNHQKVMLVDDNIFCGSLNLANHYTSVRYGDGSFRDLNIILKGHPAKKVRDFFKDIILSN